MAEYQIGSWATVNDNGDTSGDGRLTVTCGVEFYGRVKRTGTATLTGDNSGATATLTVEQSPASENITTTVAPSSIDKTAQTVTIRGYSNARGLTFSKTSDASSIATLASTYSVVYQSQSSVYNNGAAITGDPGAEDRYEWVYTVTVAANSTLSSRSFTLRIEGLDGTYISHTVTQSAGDGSISVSPTTLTFNNKGNINGSTSADVTVTSNDDWSVTIS